MNVLDGMEYRDLDKIKKLGEENNAKVRNTKLHVQRTEDYLQYMEEIGITVYLY